MSDLCHRIETVIRKIDMITGPGAIVIAVSGGSDSVSLLHILSQLFPNKNRIAVYIDHCLRPHETQAEHTLVQQQAKLCQADFVTIRVDVPKYQKRHHCSPEEAARILRYQALEEVRAKNQASCIALGHTADDQAEELLLRLIRGTGCTGLGGMASCNGKLIRPLLHETKEQLLLFLKEQNIPFCTDSSNHDPRFLRNRIRLELLPQLEQYYNPSMRQTLLHTAKIIKAEDELLEKLTKKSYQQLVSPTTIGLSLKLPSFLHEPLAIQRRIIEKICWQFNSRPTFNKIENILTICSKKTGKELHLSEGLRAIRQHGSLLFTRPTSKKGYRGPAVCSVSFPPIAVPGPGDYLVPTIKRKLHITAHQVSNPFPSLPGALVLDAKHIVFPMTLRQAKAGERFHPLGAPGSKKVLRFLSNRKIAAPEKNNYPVLLNGNTIIAIPGLQIAHPYRVTAKTKKTLHLYWHEL